MQKKTITWPEQRNLSRQFTAADLYAIANGQSTLRREPRVATEPLEPSAPKPAVLTRTVPLPMPRDRSVSAADILAISRHAQPWHALIFPERLSEAG